MKTPKFIFAAAGICGAVLATGISTTLAETDKDSTPGRASNPNPPVVSPATPPKRMTTILLPVGPTSAAKGNIVFSMAGDALNVIGRIEGLAPSTTYQLAIERPGNNVSPSAGDGTASSSAGGKPAEGKPDEGKPIAGPPVAGTPSEGKPAAGKPDGTSRPGAPGAGTSGSSVSGGKESKTAGDLTVPKPSGDLGTVTSDSAGAANVNKTLRNVEPGGGPNGIIGSSLIVRQVASDSAAGGSAVAAGVIIPGSGEGPPAGE